MNKKYVYAALAFMIIGSLILSGCAKGTKHKLNSPHKLTITTTLYPLEYFTERIGGKHVSVSNVVPPGTDAHSFEPSTKDMIKISDSDAFIYNGTGIEGFADKVNETVKKEGVKTVKAAEGLTLEKTEHHDEVHDEHGDKDPHIWLDPVYSIQMAKNIEKALIDLNPKAKSDFQKNYRSLRKDLKRLDESFHLTVNESPNKEIIVSHAAYGYWEHRYGLKQIPVSGLSTSQEPSQKQLRALIKHAKAKHIRYVLLENSASDKVARVVEKETGAKTLKLRNLETLSPKDAEADEDYLSLMQKNVQVIKQALQ
ncbi:metal ABC transporter solute-binding protein, Zn/Mn family [Fictibacillus terranigra]|uniref:Zinc ABC transporter substrate-binding protein n=1 Tax=Fictibacillus terranigra TaxID=3058424 RepID=A0ABT8E7D3_9BACL|nr:zinc ABC transporter substrate-binding protein [Fictibacillus sp. CENA-BCM004]MDN4073823.1 zinc ABC transporter substrate-binding protein [Fictibacillus sp. CENA-BCM004]